MSRPLAAFGIFAFLIGLIEFIAPGWMMSTICWMTVSAFSGALNLLEILFLGVLYTVPFALITLLLTALRMPGRWDDQVTVAGTTWIVFIILWCAIQVPAHLWMSQWVLRGIRADFLENSGGQIYECRVDSGALDRRNRELRDWGYTMYHWWEVSGDLWYDESGKPDGCNASTNAVYLFTLHPGAPPKRFDRHSW